MGGRALLVCLLPLMTAVSACGPVPVEQAEASCLRDAELAQRPRGEVIMGVGSGGGSTGAFGRVELDVSSDYLMGRDPSEVYSRCVMRRSGQAPTRALYDQPGWRG